MSTSAEKIRISGSKVRSGCRTCKRRRIKCDESRPGCKNCAKSSRNCEGYDPCPQPTELVIGHRFIHYVEPVKVTQTSNPSLDPDLDRLALRCLSFFRHRTAPQLDQPFSVHLWLQGLSSLVHSEPTIKYGLIALAALHENFQFPSDSVSVRQRKVLALEYYGRSIHHLVQLNVEDGKGAIGSNLVASLMYCAIESLQGHFSSALKHIAAAVKLLSEHDDNRPGFRHLPNHVLVAIRRIFMDLAIQATALGDRQIAEIMPKFLAQSSYAISGVFSVAEQALAEVTHLLADVMRFLNYTELTHKDANYPCTELQQSYQTLTQRYHHWIATYNHLPEVEQTIGTNGTPQERMTFLTLRMNQKMVHIALTAGFSRDEIRFDPFSNGFETIVVAAEEVLKIESLCGLSVADTTQQIFSMNLGIVPALFFACLRCRHSAIRRRALSTMKASRRREMLWDSAIVAVVAGQVITIEETIAMRHLRSSRSEVSLHENCNEEELLNSPERFPDFARIKSTDLNLDCVEDKASVTLMNTIGAVKYSQVLVW